MSKELKEIITLPDGRQIDAKTGFKHHPTEPKHNWHGFYCEKHGQTEPVIVPYKLFKSSKLTCKKCEDIKND